MNEQITVNWIKAEVQCGGCGKNMEIDIETSTAIPKGWDLIDVTKDAVCGGMGLRASLQAGLALCRKCTAAVDSIGDECYMPSDEEILQKLDSVNRKGGGL